MSRVLGIDYGDTRIGLALSDPLKIISKPYDVIINESQNYVFEQLDFIIQEKQIDILVIGLPKNMNGTIGYQGKKVKEFFSKYTNDNIKNIAYIDERLSSKKATEVLHASGLNEKKQRGIKDAYAASIILKEYLEFGV